MNDIFTNFFQNPVVLHYLKIIAPFIPIGVVGIWRWQIWVIKKAVSLGYSPTKENGYKASMSVITPVYNEDPKIFRQSLESWKANNPDEIIAVIDYADEKCIEEFNEFKKTFPGARLIVTLKPGKRPALADGVKAAKGEIVALVDSDTIWKGYIKDIILAPFIDPKVGGVGTRQDVLKPDTLARKLFNITLDYRYFFEMPFLAAAGNALTCLSGRTAVYRKSAVLEVIDEMEKEKFMGAQCISGEDKTLTRLVQMKGWKTKYQMNALVSTPGMADVMTLLKQQLRWTRNSWRSDFKSLSSLWIWKKEKILAIFMIDRFVQPFTLLLGPIYLIFSIIWGAWLAVAIILLWWFISRAVKIHAHLRRHPLDFLVIPAYIAMAYVLAVLKIYSFFTIWKQGWITRWDEKRMKKSKRFSSAPATLGTFTVMILLIFGVAGYKKAVENVEVNRKPSGILVSSSNSNIEGKKNEVLAKIAGNESGYYFVKEGDTLSLIARKFNVSASKILAANSLNNSNIINIGQKIAIPLGELGNPIELKSAVSLKNAKLYIDHENKTIYVKGTGSVVSIPGICESLNNPEMMEKVGDNEWLLKYNLYVSSGATLGVDGLWLKLKSDDSGFVWLKSYNGNISINNARITSWDSSLGTPDSNYKDGRSYILQKANGRLDIVNSDIGYLGYQGLPTQGEPEGGLYGISIKAPDYDYQKYISTGAILNSKIHDNYFGIYAFGASGISIKGNEVYNNIQYGIDPHDYSNNILVEANYVHDNGNHGIIFSNHCYSNIIRNNVSENNKLHGIMLDRQSNSNLVENNKVSGNTDGIALYDSHDNLIANNSVEKNQNGIRANANSSGNYIEENSIAKNTTGVFLYDNASSNFAVNNSVKDNTSGFYLKDAMANVLKGTFLGNIKTGGKSENNKVEETK